MSPSYVVSTDFRPIAESRFRKPCGTESYKTWYLLLRVFTQPSFPGWNPLTLVFKVLIPTAWFWRFGISQLYNGGGGAAFGECASPGVSPGVYVARLVALKRESPAAKTDEP
ncbi:MAG: hypothetical protein F6K58_16100 [Symploca sp. SIO2E9]|nr:hypothetical protein [Symploca sp. SIO2E9]